jgi:hypothetical protein
MPTTPETIAVPETVLPALTSAQAVIRDLEWERAGTAQELRIDVQSSQTRAHSVITVLAATSRAGVRRYYLKTLRATEANLDLKRAQARQEYELLGTLWQRFELFEQLGVIRPIACWPDRLSILTEGFEGEKLSRFLHRGRGLKAADAQAQIATLCRHVGQWLGLFQRFTSHPGPETFEPAELLAYCQRRLRILGDARSASFGATEAVKVMSGLERIAAHVEARDRSLVGRHNDFRPDNIVTDGARIAVLDFTGFGLGPPLYDFVKFWMKLDDLRLGIAFRPSVVRRWQRAFTEGYGQPVELGAPLCALLRAANILDKLSEAALPRAAAPPLMRRVLRTLHHRAHVRMLHHVMEECRG